MPIPFLSSIGLNKNEVQDFKVFNLASDPTLTSGGDYGYFWLNTSGTKTLKFWDGASIRSLIDSTTISSSTAGTANDLSGGVAGSLPYQQAAGDTTFLGIGTADQVLTVNSGATAPQWLSQSSLSVGSATNKTGGNLGDILVQSGSGTTGFLNAGTAGQVITSNGASPQYVNQSTLSVGSATTSGTATNIAGGAANRIPYQTAAGTTAFIADAANSILTTNASSVPALTAATSVTVGKAVDIALGAAGDLLYQSASNDTSFLNIGANGSILTSTGTAPQWSASIPSGSVSGLAASATTDTTNASNISSGTLGLARLALATGQFYVGDASNNPAATLKSSIPLSGFGAAGADVAMGGFKITGLADPAAATDAATRGYVDSVAQGLDVKASCLVATTADITLASPGAVTIDGIYSATDFTAGTTRILVKDQSAPAENGIYIWQGPAAAMTRSADANTWDELVGAFTFIERGTANADSGWVCSVNAGGTLGSTAVTWVKFSQAGSYTQGRGMVLDGTAFNFAQNTNYTAGRIPFASGPTTIGFNANLHWDNGNNRLGIGTATPTVPLDVVGAASVSGVLTVSAGTAAAPAISPTGDSNTGVYFPAADTVGVATGGVQGLQVTSTRQVFTGPDASSGGFSIPNGIGNSVAVTLGATTTSGFCSIAARVNDGTRGHRAGIFVDDTNSRWGISHTYSSVAWPFVITDAGVERLRIDTSGNVGIGTTTPAVKFHLSGSDSILALLNGATKGVRVSFNAAESKIEGVDNTGTGSYQPLSIGGSEIRFDLSNSRKATLDSSGNLGLGVTPSAWAAGYSVFEAGGAFGRGGLAVRGLNSSPYAQTWLTMNAYRETDSTNDTAGWKTSAGSTSAAILIGGNDNNVIKFLQSPWTAGGNAITWTQAMTLDASGNLGIGTPTPAYKLDVLGAIASNNGTIKTGISYGSTGVIGTFSNHNLSIITNDATVATFTTSGNLGLGVTPNTWAAVFRAIQFPDGYAAIAGDNGNGVAEITSNAYNDGAWKFRNAQGAVRYRLDAINKTHTWFNTSTTPTANGAITWTPAMTLDASGRLAIGTTTINERLEVYGYGKFSSGWKIDTQGIAYGDTGNSLVIGADPGNASANSSIQLMVDGSERLRIKSTGQINFVGLASDPAGAAGDVVYNSTSNRLKYHNGTAWVNTGTNKYSGALAGTGTSFTVTHNLGTRDVTVAVRKSGSTYDQVFTDVQMTDTNTVTIIFASSVTGSDYTVTVIG